MDTETQENEMNTESNVNQQDVNMDADESVGSRDSNTQNVTEESVSMEQLSVQESDKPSDNINEQRTEGHRAGFDAFMTGFIFACNILEYGQVKKATSGSEMSFKDFKMEEYGNKLCLTGKDIPLQIIRSSFSKTSKDHKEKLQRILQQSD